MYNMPGDILDALRATPGTLAGLLRGVSESQARLARGGDEHWSVIEVLCHLRDCEERAIERMRLMRDQSNPYLAPFDQDQWAAERDYASARLQDTLDAYRAMRATHVRELEQLPPASWDRPGHHAEQGDITLISHEHHIVSHDAIHMAQIAHQLNSLSS